MRTRRRAIIHARGHHATAHRPRAGHVRREATLTARMPKRAAGTMPRVGQHGVESIEHDAHGRVEVRIRLDGMDRLADALRAASVKVREFAKLLSPALTTPAMRFALDRAARDDHERRIIPTDASYEQRLEDTSPYGSAWRELRPHPTTHLSIRGHWT